MGKRIISQNRGRGSPLFRAKKHRIRLSSYGNWIFKRYAVSELLRDKYRVIARLDTTEGDKWILAARGIATRRVYDPEKPPMTGGVYPLSAIPLKSEICAFQTRAFGPANTKKAPGCRATVVAHDFDEQKAALKCVIVRYGRGGEVKKLDPRCRAILGVAAGGGMGLKPFLKAGNAFFHFKKTHKRWPRVSG